MTVKWVDEESLSVSVLPVSKPRAVVPPPSDIVPGVVGKVRFSGSKTYRAEVIAVGKLINI